MTDSMNDSEQYGTKFTVKFENGYLSINFNSSSDSHDITLWISEAIKNHSKEIEKDFYTPKESSFHHVNRLSRMGIELIKKKSLTMLSKQDLEILYNSIPLREDTAFFIHTLNYYKCQASIRDDGSEDSILIGDQIGKTMNYTLTG